jgi:hypothetical protein
MTIDFFSLNGIDGAFGDDHLLFVEFKEWL